MSVTAYRFRTTSTFSRYAEDVYLCTTFLNEHKATVYLYNNV